MRIVIILVLLAGVLPGQTLPQIEWIKKYNTANVYGSYLGNFTSDKSGSIYFNDYNKWIKVDADGNPSAQFEEKADSNYLIFGSHLAFDDEENVFEALIKKKNISPVTFQIILKRYDENGNEIWKNIFDGYSPSCLRMDNNGNLILGFYDGANIQIKKFLNNGDLVWEKSFPDYSGLTGIYFKNDNIYFSSWKTIPNTDPPDENHFLNLLSSDGSLMWSREKTYPPAFDINANIIFGGKDGTIYKIDNSGNEIWKCESDLFSVSSIAIDSENNIIVFGSRYDLAGNSGRNILIKKISQNGIVEWVNEFNSTETEYSIDELHGFAIDDANSIYLTSRSFRGDLQYCYTLKYSESGIKEYELKMQDGENSNFLGNKIFLDKNGYYICGTSDNEIFISKISDQSLTGQMHEKYSVNSFSLLQNYPNPFNPATVISFRLPETAQVKLEIFNLLGEKLCDLIDTELTEGNHEFNFDAESFSSGVYIYKLTAGKYFQSRKMILAK